MYKLYFVLHLEEIVEADDEFEQWTKLLNQPLDIIFLRKQSGDDPAGC